MNIADINFNAIWKETMGWNVEKPNDRKFNDEIEAAFWVKLAPQYTALYNLNDDTPEIAEKLKVLLGEGKTILEIGPGSGNFTMKMAAYSKEILGVDFSPAMLSELQKRAIGEGASNIKTVASKWEDFFTDERFDAIVSVNSLYRIEDIEAALLKMCLYGKKIILIRTIQRDPLYSILHNCGLPCRECMDYRIMPEIFWKHGILANVEFLTYPVRREYVSWKEIEHTLILELGKDTYITNKEALIKEIELAILSENDKIVLGVNRTTVFITAGI